MIIIQKRVHAYKQKYKYTILSCAKLKCKCCFENIVYLNCDACGFTHAGYKNQVNKKITY